MDNTKKLIGIRLNAALASSGKLQKELAHELGDIPPNTISYFCNGSRTPNTEQVIKICRFLGVSADWLLGLSETMTVDADLSAAQKYTGLSDIACEELHNWKKYLKADGAAKLETLSELISETSFPYLKNILTCIHEGRTSLKVTVDRLNKNLSEKQTEDSLIQLSNWCDCREEDYRYTRFIMQDNAIKAFDNLLREDYNAYTEKIQELDKLTHRLPGGSYGAYRISHGKE